MTPAEKLARIATLTRWIASAEAQIETLVTQNVQNYSVNDGQSSQSVNKKKIEEFDSLIASWTTERDRLREDVAGTGGAGVHLNGGW